ncbi:hypothetical protein LY76DRAFT_152656 [Colletotrichum caudatum]|nr:hypothetical protein LY76DRAFT_152656 [Colletotrichum caudatum]
MCYARPITLRGLPRPLRDRAPKRGGQKTQMTQITVNDLVSAQLQWQLHSSTLVVAVARLEDRNSARAPPPSEQLRSCYPSTDKEY